MLARRPFNRSLLIHIVNGTRQNSTTVRPQVIQNRRFSTKRFVRNTSPTVARVIRTYAFNYQTTRHLVFFRRRKRNRRHQGIQHTMQHTTTGIIRQRIRLTRIQISINRTLQNSVGRTGNRQHTSPLIRIMANRNSTRQFRVRFRLTRHVHTIRGRVSTVFLHRHDGHLR